MKKVLQGFEFRSHVSASMIFDTSKIRVDISAIAHFVTSDAENQFTHYIMRYSFLIEKV